MDQLTAVDAMFLDVEDENTPMNIGGVSVHEGPAPSFDEIRSQVAGRLDYSPRYRQRIKRMPVGLGRPIWVDDVDFDLDNHLTEVDLGPAPTLEDICDHYAETMSKHFDRDRPLWKVQICRNLPDGEWAILWSVHHAVVDGIAATDLLALLLSPDKDAEPAEGQEWTPTPAPAKVQTVTSAARGEIGPLKLARGVQGAAREPSRSIRHVARTLRGMLPVGRTLIESREATPINGPVGSSRTWRVTELDLTEVKRAAKLHGGTVNDLVLTAVTDGMRENLIARGESLDGLRIRSMVPVSVRGDDEAGVAANRVSAVFVDLPVDVEDPRQRMMMIREQMDEIKANRGEQTAKALGDFADYLPHSVFAFGERSIMRTGITRFFNTTTTNVPGPQFPLYCLGRRMRALYPYIMLIKDTRISTAVFSYDGKIYFGVTGDAAGIFDIERICSGVSGAVERVAALKAVPDSATLDTLVA